MAHLDLANPINEQPGFTAKAAGPSIPRSEPSASVRAKEQTS